MRNATSLLATRLSVVAVTALAAVASADERPTAAQIADTLRADLTGAIVTDGECASAMRLTDSACRSGVLGPVVEILMNDRDTTAAMLSELSQGQRRRFLADVLASDPPIHVWLRSQLMRLVSSDDAEWMRAEIDRHAEGSTAAWAAELKTLSLGSPSARMLTGMVLADPSGYAALRNAGVAMGLVLFGNHRTEVVAGLIRDLETGSPCDSATAAHIVRMIGVARISEYRRIVAMLGDAGRLAIEADLRKMAQSATRDGLAIAVHLSQTFAAER